jgi:hypothetical protein
MPGKKQLLIPLGNDLGPMNADSCFSESQLSANLGKPGGTIGCLFKETENNSYMELL